MISNPVKHQYILAENAKKKLTSDEFSALFGGVPSSEGGTKSSPEKDRGTPKPSPETDGGTPKPSPEKDRGTKSSPEKDGGTPNISPEMDTKTSHIKTSPNKGKKVGKKLGRSKPVSRSKSRPKKDRSSPMFRKLTSTATNSLINKYIPSYDEEDLTLTDLHVTSPESSSSSLVEVSPASLVDVSSDDGLPPPSSKSVPNETGDKMIERLIRENDELKLSMLELISEVRADRKKQPSHPVILPVKPKKKVTAGSIQTIGTDDQLPSIALPSAFSTSRVDFSSVEDPAGFTESATGHISPQNAALAELEKESRREAKLKPPYLQKTDPLSCYNFALEWRRYSRARGRGIDAAKHLHDLENQVQAWRSIADPKTMDELLSPFEDQLSINKPTHGEPLHGLDLARDLLLNVDIRGLQLHVDPIILTSWKNDGTIPTFLNNWYIWERIILNTQAENPRQGEALIANCMMDWSTNKRFRSNRERWDDYLRRFTRVANACTLIPIDEKHSYSFDVRLMMKYFARNVGIPIVFHDVEYFFKDKEIFKEYTTNEIIKNIKDRYLNWCSQHPNLDLCSVNLGVFVDHSFPIVPGTQTMLIGIDLLNKLGLLTEDSLVIKLDKEHNIIMKDESEFDQLMSNPPSMKSIRDTDHSTSFNPVESGCTITLDNPLLNQQLSSLLEEFRIIFQSAPHPDGIDCPPMRIPFHDESTVVKRKPRFFNPEKLKIANGIFDELIEQGFAVSSPQSKFSSPVVLVTYPDHRKPRLTGDYSGTGGVNDLTVPIASDLPNIADVITFCQQQTSMLTLLVHYPLMLTATVSS
ncbi:hypothetical protein GEMRC1_003231 [Eukaryota sp. GEM-RC1]